MKEEKINQVGKALARADGWVIESHVNIMQSSNPRVRHYAYLAAVTIDKIESFERKHDEQL